MDLKAMVRAAALEGKAIPARQELMSPDPIRVGNGSFRRSYLSQRTASQHLQAYGGKTDAIDWIMSCVGLIAETAGAADWHFETKDGKRLLNHRDADLPGEPVADQMLVKLFEEPNPYMDYAELVELTMIDYLLTGNAYWLKWRTNSTGKPLALYRLAPPLVEVMPGPMGVEGYKYTVDGYDPLEVPPEAILHFKRPNPHNPYLGLGLVQGGARMLDLELALTDTQASYYEKRAQPSMVVQSDRRVPRDVFNKLKAQLRAFYSGPRNAGNLMVLEAGLRYQSIAPNASEAAFDPLTRLSRGRIASLFRVPLPLLGVLDEATGISLPDAQRLFDTKTMRPLLDKFQKAISYQIVRAWEEARFIVDYDYIMPIEDRIRLASTFGAMPGVTIKEVRKYAGLPPLGDARDDLVLNLPGENGPAGTHPAIADRNAAGEPGRPPNPGNTAVIPDPNAPGGIPHGAAVRPKPQAKSMSVEDALEAFETIEIGRKAPSSGSVKLETPGRPYKPLPPDTLARERVDAVDGIVGSAEAELRAAAEELGAALAAELDTKAGGVVTRLRKSKAWTAFTETLASRLQTAVRNAVAQGVLHAGRLGRRAEDEINYDVIAREIINRPGEGVRSMVQTLKDQVAKAVREGEDAATALSEAITEWQDGKAHTIALTEATHGYNEAMLTVSEATGVKEMHVFDGDHHDEACKEANGQVWPIAFARENRLQHPNCRRSFLPVEPVA